jgi:hypothetical protein
MKRFFEDGRTQMEDQSSITTGQHKEQTHCCVPGEALTRDASVEAAKYRPFIDPTSSEITETFTL